MLSRLLLLPARHSRSHSPVAVLPHLSVQGTSPSIPWVCDCISNLLTLIVLMPTRHASGNLLNVSQIPPDVLRAMRFVPLPRKLFRGMTKQEMAYVIRQQLGFLQSSDPLADDFYFQVFNARKGNPGKIRLFFFSLLTYSHCGRPISPQMSSPASPRSAYSVRSPTRTIAIRTAPLCCRKAHWVASHRSPCASPAS
mgnify:CR=1 FL=1